jgi:hypothetical protein
VLLAEANEICAGEIRLFGGDPRSLQLTSKTPLEHWTRTSHQPVGGDTEDIKLVWEPGRFGWAVTLARAYHLSRENRYAQAFWAHTETFLDANPPNLGPHWVSAQEVALRLIALTFAAHVFQTGPEATPARLARLLEALDDHARRIPPSLAYARAQENNHLLSEAAGLYTAGLLLPDHPEAPRWRALGWGWFHQGLQDQIAPDGTYVQQSTNYHRLMLQLGLWVAALAKDQGEAFPPESLSRLALAVRWLHCLSDPDGGETPNLGPNDGAHILPLAACSHQDYRPTLAAAGAAFLDRPLYPPGPWDETGLWLGWTRTGEAQAETAPQSSPAVLRNPASESWGYLRAVRFTRRPGHADQLHFDLWWRGTNVALDPGTYHYNAALPWENALSGTDVHNTVTLNGQDQMTRAGRFLWLDWAQATLAPADSGRLIAVHDGYRRFKVVHKRSVTALEAGGWAIRDALLPSDSTPGASGPVHARLHWLLPDWPWEILPGEVGVQLTLAGPPGRVQLAVQTDPKSAPVVALVRAGELVFGAGTVQPHWGWRAPTYAHKIPALSFGIAYTGSVPFGFTTEWHLEPKN